MRCLRMSCKSENISPSFVSRILRLAYLSPTLVEAILDGKYPAHLTMNDLMELFPMDWVQIPGPGFLTYRQ